MVNPLWQTLLKSVLNTKTYEFSCEECYNIMDQYADLLINGADPAQVMPLAKEHLSNCPNCADLFHALLQISESANQLVSESVIQRVSESVIQQAIQ